eukprot:CAMPEP_0197867356 /NCGR_PEP_ID=MMETSP1438-20131217/44714_1 /TAXON_ID=1461541 /ORGANISM="Pterosperma sp., Strain CCMP1384" /LENGTH=37 /DNA_ID= /DNA_START= /DNA_END= /DNA_ORIENTATION=
MALERHKSGKLEPQSSNFNHYVYAKCHGVKRLDGQDM